VILVGASYEQTWQGITDLVAALSVDQRHAIMGGTAERVYGL
jgi:predicted TIM-barrel fold metal-dependent hydrolase